jgi:hypothetical protein
LWLARVQLWLHGFADERQNSNTVLTIVLAVDERVVKPMPLRHSGRRVTHLAGRQKMFDFRPGQPLRRVAQRIRDGLKLTLVLCQRRSARLNRTGETTGF